MAVFDPNDWWERGSWLRSARLERRRPEEVNQEVVTRWLASVALCRCFAALAPAEHLLLACAGMLVMAALASAGLALIRQEAFDSPHLTPWDEAAWSLAAGLALGLWSAPPGFGTL